MQILQTIALNIDGWMSAGVGQKRAPRRAVN